ncbi:RNA-directed DNA polymerase [Gossypium australe]|uniref:RNA-directed DNA polymerase n=1 Tax=Gossypium australe TaxID=47621 RepID=A0A5B6WX29_9ROSI|nr:RNA-directed DNA polymerase [Gossypium australe]
MNLFLHPRECSEQLDCGGDPCNINDVSDATTDSESLFERDMVVQQEEKQILPHKESVEIKEVKIGACITAETKRNLIELLQEFKDVFAWSYQGMPGLSTDIMVHWLLIKEECKPI